MNRIEYDRATQEWFNKHPDVRTTTTQCPVCGLYFKTSLNHDCELRRTDFGWVDGYMADGTPVELKLSSNSSARSLQLALYRLLTEKETSNNG